MNTTTPKRSSRSPRRSSAEKAKMLSSKVKSIRGIVSDDWKPSLGSNGSYSSLDDLGKEELTMVPCQIDSDTEAKGRSRRGSPNSVVGSHHEICLSDNKEYEKEEEYEVEEEEMQIISCPACGSTKSPEGANFCSHCGHRLPSLHDSFNSDGGNSQAGGRSVGSSGSRSSSRSSRSSSKRRKGPRKPRRSVTMDETEANRRSKSSRSRSRSGSRTPRQKSSRDVVGTGPTVLARNATTPGALAKDKLAAARAKGRTSSAKMRRSTTVGTVDSTSVASEESFDQILEKSQRKNFRRSSSFASSSPSGFEGQLAEIRKQISQKILQSASAHGTQKQGDRAALVNAIRSQSCRELNTKNEAENDAATRHVAKHVNQKTRRVPAINRRSVAKKAASKSPPRNSLPSAGKPAAAGTVLKFQNNSSSGSISSISCSTGFTSKDDTTLSSMGSADVPAPLPPTLSRWEPGMTSSGHGTKEAADSIPNCPEQDLSSMCSSSISGYGNGGLPHATAMAKLASASLLEEEEEEPETPRSSSGRNKLYPDILFPATPCESTRSGISALTTPTCFRPTAGVGIVTPGSVTETPNSIQLSAVGMPRPRVPSVGYEFSATNSTNHVSDLSCSSSFLQSSSSSFLYSGSTQFSSSQTRLAKFLSTPTIEEEVDATSANKKGDCIPRMVRRHSFDSVSACSALEPSNNNDTDDSQPMPPQRRLSIMPTTA